MGGMTPVSQWVLGRFLAFALILGTVSLGLPNVDARALPADAGSIPDSLRNADGSITLETRVGP